MSCARVSVRLYSMRIRRGSVRLVAARGSGTLHCISTLPTSEGHPTWRGARRGTRPAQAVDHDAGRFAHDALPRDGHPDVQAPRQ
eukprot:1927982-Alexandrium_andersonii.AAC.1